MLQSLKKKLILLCGITTSTILTVVVIFMLFVMINQSEQHKQELFEKNVDTVLEKIKDSYMIKHSWLTQMEVESQLVIYLEDQGQALTYKGSYNTPTNRSILISTIKEKAELEGIDFSSNPIAPSIIKSSDFTLEKDFEYYRGIAVIIPLNTGWRSMILVQWVPERNLDILKLTILYLSINVVGCGMLFLLSSFFIGKAIKPVEENHQRQVEFIAAASHELRSPLTVILASISSLKEDITQSDSYLPHIEGECIRMTRLISDMLLLATSDAKTWTLKKEVIDMDSFLIEAYDLFTPFMCANEQILSLELSEEPLYPIYGDKERLKQLLTIIVDNATTYSVKNSGIQIKAYNDKKNVVLEIVDHGTGIPDDQKEVIFNRFYRGEKSRTDKKHYGLGLSIAQELVKIHAGKIYVKDTVGGGATFVIRLEQNYTT